MTYNVLSGTLSVYTNTYHYAASQPHLTWGDAPCYKLQMGGTALHFDRWST